MKNIITTVCTIIPLFSLSQIGPGGVSLNNQFWVKAQSGISLVGSDVSVWADQSGNGNNAIQNTNTYRPSFNSSAINYNPSVYFDGTNEHLNINNLIASGGTQVHIFAVGTNETGGDSWHSMVFGQSSTSWTGGGYGITALNGNSSFGFWVNNYSAYNVYTSWIDQPFGIIEGMYNGSVVEFFKNSTTFGTSAYTGSIGNNGSTHLGGGHSTYYNHKGFISEVAIYSSALSTIDRNKINSYFGIKYGITQGRSGISGNYINSLGNTIFSDDNVSTYWNDIIGIGRDDDSELHQKQTRTPDDTTRLYISTLATDNASNAGNFTLNNQFVVMGHNSEPIKSKGSNEFPSGLGIFSRIEREWKITNTNFNGTFSIDMKLNTSPINPSHIRILIDDDGDFLTGASMINPTITLTGSVLTISDISNTYIPTNSTRYITVVSLNEITHLPIELSSFEAINYNDIVNLNWQTTSEINNNYFTVERSKNGTNWEGIERINGAGNSLIALNYQTKDVKPYMGVSYYRLKQTDFDGNHIFSNIKSVTIKEKLQLHQNYSENKITIVGNKLKNTKINIYNSIGQDVTTLINKSFNNNINIDLTNLKTGIYYIKIGDIHKKIYKH